MTSKERGAQILFEHDFQKDIIVKALEIVRKFIIMNKRILTGGMAIDMVLREHNSKLYDDNKLPDYDFYSPVFHIDAYTLGEQLAKEFTNISVIRATHTSTMRVRVNFVVVADITYVPQNIYDNIPIITCKGFTVVHPHYQMIDQHRSLSLPYENPPRETIMHRWKKDMERYDLLIGSYPVTKTKTGNLKKNKYNITFDLLDGECIGGYAALMYWFNEANVLDYFDYKPGDVNNLIGNLAITDKAISINLVDNAYFTLLTDNITDIFKKFSGNKAFYNSVLDKIPRKVLIENKDNNFEIIDNRGRFICAHKPYSTKRMWISNLQDVMCYLLTLSTFYKSSLAQNAYILARSILTWACTEFASSKKETYMRFLPTTEVFGQYNWSDAYATERQYVTDLINKKHDMEVLTPKNAYPTNTKTISNNLYAFQPTKSKLYQIDGMKTSEFVLRVLD